MPQSFGKYKYFHSAQFGSYYCHISASHKMSRFTEDHRLLLARLHVV